MAKAEMIAVPNCEMLRRARDTTDRFRGQQRLSPAIRMKVLNPAYAENLQGRDSSEL